MRYKYDRYYYGTYYYQTGQGNLVDDGMSTSISGWSGYDFNSGSGYYVTGSFVTKTIANNTVFTGGGTYIRSQWLQDGHSWSMYYYAGASSYRSTYIDTIIAEDGTYPTDGISGSYWYVRTTPVVFQVLTPDGIRDVIAVDVIIPDATAPEGKAIAHVTLIDVLTAEGIKRIY